MTPQHRLGDTLGNVALIPFWLAGRLLRILLNLFTHTATYIRASFNDGLDAGASDDTHNTTALALVVVWLIVLTVAVL